METDQITHTGGGRIEFENNFKPFRSTKCFWTKLSVVLFSDILYDILLLSTVFHYAYKNYWENWKWIFLK